MTNGFEGRRRIGTDGATDANFANKFWNTSRLFDAYSKQGGAASTMALRARDPDLDCRLTGLTLADYPDNKTFEQFS